MTFSEHIAQTVRRHRRAAKLTQLGLAELAAVGKTVVFDVEHGKPSVRLDTLLKILAVLGIELRLMTPLPELEHDDDAR